MTSATIEVAYCNPVKDGKKMASIKTTEGESYLVWPNQFGLFQQGRRYEVDFEESTFNSRTYRKVTKVRPLDTPQAAKSNGTGHPAPASSSPSAEMDFVSRVVAAGVQGGAINFEAHSLTQAISITREVWRRSFGN